MANTQRVEIGFAGGQVVSVRLAEKPLADLRQQVERHEDWYDLETDDGSVAIDLSKVVFVRIAGAPHTIGFSGD
jgi:hypothetical protein